MTGDSILDMEFARKLGVRQIFIHQKNDIDIKDQEIIFDLNFDSLFTSAEKVKN